MANFSFEMNNEFNNRFGGSCKYSAGIPIPAWNTAWSTKQANALASRTGEHELALTPLGISAGDEVIIPSGTLIASATCTVLRGAAGPR
jgi:hypothetical protein